MISPNLFRVQKLGTKDYNFRHHLETQLLDNSKLNNIAYKRIRSPKELSTIVKVRINHLGQFVQLGEY
ncbi:hypothetical protein D3C86_1956710 [compost metagenome]